MIARIRFSRSPSISIVAHANAGQLCWVFAALVPQDLQVEHRIFCISIVDELLDQYIVIFLMLKRFKHPLCLMIMFHLALFDIRQPWAIWVERSSETFVNHLFYNFFLSLFAVFIWWCCSCSLTELKHFFKLVLSFFLDATPGFSFSINFL